MRAVVYDAIGSAPTLQRVPAPACPDDGAVIDVRATGICRSDWHAWKGHDPVVLPHVPGHEFAGVIAEVGPLVRNFAVGQRVTAPFVNGCGDCEWCRDGQAQVCPSQTQPGFTQPGSFAEQVAINHADFNLVPLPDELDFVTAASLGCRFATAFHALTAQGGLEPGEWLVIFGCGGLGLSAVMVGVALGARVIAIDPSDQARERASQLGAEATLESGDTALIASLTDGGAHVSVDALGSGQTAASSIRCLRRRGRHVQVGLMYGSAADAPMPWAELVSRELRVVGSHGMAACDYRSMLAMIVDGRLNPSKLIGRVVTLDEAGAELMAMDAPIAAGAGLVVAQIER